MRLQGDSTLRDRIGTAAGRVVLDLSQGEFYLHAGEPGEGAGQHAVLPDQRHDVVRTGAAEEQPAVLERRVLEGVGEDLAELVDEVDRELFDDVETKRRLWDGVFDYDLNAFAPGGPDDSPGTGFLAITPTRALVLKQYGMGGMQRWRA